tara:strand:- start:367 stop:666 length:300 start_codon:yes stop_codon:yes gene_type:complete
MIKTSKQNLTKKDISNKIHSNIGLSNLYTNKITDNLILILKELIKDNKFSILNFGTFRVINKSERIGRNPKNKKIYKIKARKSLSFIASKNLIKKINSL